eukprot:7204742-Ditylum_brightwellii.AAC.1
MDAICQDHKAAITRYYTALNVDKTLEKQLTEAVHPLYTSALQVPLMGFTNVSAIAIVQHLYQNNGRVTPAMMVNADACIREKFDPTLPIEVLFTGMDEVQDLATVGENTYSDAQLTNITYNLIFSTGVHNDVCKEWIRLTPAGRTWAGFKPHFTAAHRMLHKMHHDIKLRSRESGIIRQCKEG